MLPAAYATPQQRSDELRTTLTAIADGDGSAGRRAAIVAALRAAGVELELQEFVDRRQRPGTNIVARIPGPGRRLLVAAHYDRVAVGRGVVDNGGACAALVDLLRTLKTAPLARHALDVVFFDLEEAGLAGSRAYFARTPAPRPEHAINLDVFAYGDALFATASNPDGPLMRALREAGHALNLPVRDAPVARYPGSDHRSMMDAKIDTLGIALVDAPDIDIVLASGTRGAGTPNAGARVLTIIHSPRDTLAEARADDIVKGVSALEQLLRTIDREPADAGAL
ncbi:MAG TPA: M28 family peptidase [Vicinamibacterales bacterium]|nr:M28 family peptidase [Vicinamibacterales bacterium]